MGEESQAKRETGHLALVGVPLDKQSGHVGWLRTK